MALITESDIVNDKSEEMLNQIKEEKDYEENAIVEESYVDEPMESIENKEIQRLKEQNQNNRRRSLRNEQASKLKVKPAKFDEILNCYRKREYMNCIVYIDLVADTTKDCIEYQILKATCLVNLGQKLPEAHRILDEIIKQRPTNAYSVYSKGLACYQECRYEDAISYFDKAISLDPSGMQRAVELKKLALSELETENLPTIKNDEESADEQMDYEHENEASKELSKSPLDRFACDICGKRFGKKYNLDRHNKALHNRETPYIPPKVPQRRSAPPSVLEPEIKIKEEKLDEPEIKEKKPSPLKQTKINMFGKKKVKKPDSSKLPNGMARCNICRKVYSKGSLARHMVIHSGHKGFECGQCGKAFYQKSDLQRHETIHSDNYDFECKQCDKKFRIKKNLQVHNKRHHSN